MGLVDFGKFWWVLVVFGGFGGFWWFLVGLVGFGVDLTMNALGWSEGSDENNPPLPGWGG